MRNREDIGIKKVAVLDLCFFFFFFKVQKRSRESIPICYLFPHRISTSDDNSPDNSPFSGPVRNKMPRNFFSPVQRDLDSDPQSI